ncbi:NAD(P)-dependent oxidoreductase [Paracoccus sp. 08]|uniref:NAD(P)-dependent oxidoreductase n=1 Tax=Paracoccus sp. 08 TaxID=2606624 RepID=UPI002095E72D|nr:NAD(P)-dependent oxidoreductase [Paracoccus sp. 08]MCO6362687.1 D-glycerate dehydrogenase [Paracoccus sp. 08]
MPATPAAPRSRLRVAVTRRLPEAVETRMSELFDVALRDDDRKMSSDQLVSLMQDADVLVPTVTDQITAAMLARAGERLKLIANFGAGIDHIDVMSARQRGVLVSNTPGVVTEDTADMTLALILAVTRKIPEGLAEMQAGRWQGWSPTAHLGGRVGGRRLGILGMGRIGQAVARRAAAFGMQVHYHNRRRLRRMLRAGEIAGAGLDVFEHGHEINPRLRELPNVVLLPHMGSATVEGRAEMGEKVIINIKTFADGHRPPDLVVPSML